MAIVPLGRLLWLGVLDREAEMVRMVPVPSTLWKEKEKEKETNASAKFDYAVWKFRQRRTTA